MRRHVARGAGLGLLLAVLSASPALAGDSVPVTPCVLAPNQYASFSHAPPDVPASTTLPGDVVVPDGAAVYGTTHPDGSVYYTIAPRDWVCKPVLNGMDGELFVSVSEPGSKTHVIDAVYEAGGVGPSMDLPCPYIQALEAADRDFRKGYANVFCPDLATGEIALPLPTGSSRDLASAVLVPPDVKDPKILSSGKGSDAVYGVYTGSTRTGEHQLGPQAIDCTLPDDQREVCAASLELFLASSNIGKAIGEGSLNTALDVLDAFIHAGETEPGERRGPDRDRDGLPDTTEQTLAQKYAPVLLFDPSESEYPIGVDQFFSQSQGGDVPPNLSYFEDCGSFLGGPNDVTLVVRQGPLSQDDLLHSAKQESACGRDDFKPLTSFTEDPQAPRYGGSEPKESFFVRSVDEDQARSLDTKHWLTYFHAYPTRDGGVMIQYWHFFAHNDFHGGPAGFASGHHQGDWDAMDMVKLDEHLNIESVWYSRHSDDAPGSEMKSVQEYVPGATTQANTAYLVNGTHPMVMVDSGGHASYASPADYCSWSEPVSNFSADAAWGDPSDPGEVSEVSCDRSTPNVGDNNGGTVWLTYPGAVTQGGHVDHSPEGIAGGPLRNLGEYNPGTMKDCSACVGLKPSCCGGGEPNFFPLAGGAFIGFSGLWGSPAGGEHSSLYAYPPHGPVFQGFDKDSGMYTSWYNEAAGGRWQPRPRATPFTCSVHGALPCPPGAPGAPTHLKVQPENGALDVSWQPPADHGSSPISSYTIQVLNPDAPGPRRYQGARGDATSARVDGLTADCHTAYLVAVSAVNAAGEGPVAGGDEPARPSGVSGPEIPRVVLVLLDGVESEHPGESFDPLGKVTSQGLHGYCPEDPDHHATVFKPSGLDDFMHKWNFTQAAPVDLHTLAPTHRFMLDDAAARGAIVLPYSYAGAKLSGSTFTAEPYTIDDSSNGDVRRAASRLGDEIDSIHSTWPNARIVVIGHSNGGLVAMWWWQTSFHDRSDHHGVAKVFSLDSPINGVRMLATGCGLGVPALLGAPCGYAGTYKALWDHRTLIDRGLLAKDSGNSYEPVGTERDPTFVQGNNLTNPLDTDVGGGDSDHNSLCSQLLSTSDSCDAANAPQPPNFVSPCAIDDNGPKVLHDTSGIGHFVVKFCPGVVDEVNKTVLPLFRP